MRRFAIALFLLLAPALPAAADDPRLPRQISATEYGPFKLGTPADVLFKGRLLVPEAKPPSYQGPDDCYYASLPNPPKNPPQFMIENRRLARIDVDQPGILTPAGLQVGDSIDRLLKALGKDPGFQAENRELLGGKPDWSGDSVLVSPPRPGSPFALAYWISERRITHLSIGTKPLILSDEGCGD